MATAWHKPDDIEKVTQSQEDLKAQAESLGLETGEWWNEDEHGDQ